MPGTCPVQTQPVETFDVFYSTWRSKKLLKGKTVDQYWLDRGLYCCSVEMSSDTTLEEVLEECRLLGHFGTGTHNTGPWEVHCSRGVWEHRKGSRNLGRCREQDIVFRSWEEIENSN